MTIKKAAAGDRAKSVPRSTASTLRGVSRHDAFALVKHEHIRSRGRSVRILKWGCRVEERRFEHIDRMLPCVAVYLIVAWRTLMVCRLARCAPDLACEAIFDPAEWKSV